MGNGEITTEIERFIHDNINSVEQLEVLLLLNKVPDKEWSAIEVGRKLYREPISVAVRLADLQSKGLLTCRRADTESLYRYTPEARRDFLIGELEAAFRIRQDAIIRLIFSGPSDNIRAFSNAFRIVRRQI